MSAPEPVLPSDLALHEQLSRTWARRRGLFSWFAQTDHHTIGRRFVFTAFVWFALGGLLAGLMRIQLARPGNTFLTADQYDQVFTLHGITMMFLFAVPVMEAVAIFVLPLMLGTRALAFPRANAYAYYMFLFGGMMVYVAFFLNMAPDAGWFNYVPLASPEFAPGKRVDIWAELVNFTEVSALVVAVQIIVTICKQRAPGMSINRMPLYVWSMLVTAIMIVFAMPSVMVASNFIGLDRLVGTHFFNPAEGGHPLLWQHLFWFFGHPEVYIIFIPGLGMVSTLVAAFCRRPVFGYTAMVLSMVATAFIGFGLWVHHMFATGLPQSGESFFTAASMMIAIPSGVQIFCWIATIWMGKPVYRPPFLFALGFLAIFVLGGLSGVMVASIPLDVQLHDTFFVVAHLHYVLIGGAIMPLMGAVYFWFPKMTGRLMHEGVGKISALLVFVGFNLTFFPMHQLGMMGMPRRIYSYGADQGWGSLNLLATIGAFTMGLGFVLTFINAIVALRRGKLAGNDPWRADGLEWTTTSPPPPHNYTLLPTVCDRYAAWTTPADQPIVHGVRADRPEVLITGLMDAEPDHRFELPSGTLVPFFAALATGFLFITAIYTPWGVPVGALLLLVPMLAWVWPQPPHREEIMEANP
jgi:cytochrome c oxidase subunit 1